MAGRKILSPLHGDGYLHAPSKPHLPPVTHLETAEPDKYCMDAIDMIANRRNNYSRPPTIKRSEIIILVSATSITTLLLLWIIAPYYSTSTSSTNIYNLLWKRILWSRYKQHDGTVTIEMLQIPKLPFLYIGFWDSLGDILGIILVHLSCQDIKTSTCKELNIIFSAIFSNWILKKIYTKSQIGSMGLVLCGSIITLLPVISSQMFTTNHEEDISNNKDKDGASPTTTATTSLFYAIVYICSVAPTALAFVLKEQIFDRHRELNLDIFVVNTYGSIVSLVFTILLLPLAAIPGFGIIVGSAIIYAMWI